MKKRMPPKHKLITDLAKGVAAQQARQNADKTGFDTALNHLCSDSITDMGLIAILADIESITCTFCRGKGHNAGQCASKKAVDHAVMTCPHMKKLWGTIKAAYMSSGKKIGVKRAASKALDGWDDIQAKAQ